MKRAWLALAVVGVGCLHPSTSPSVGAGSTTLKGAFAGSFRVGAAVNERQFTGADSVGAALIRRQFNTITPENVLKWENVHPRLGVYDFAAADRYVNFGTHNGMFVIGHTLVWHSQVPAWVFKDSRGDPLTRDALLARMQDHIATVVGRYRGRINGWDVVNEALNDDGTSPRLALAPDHWRRLHRQGVRVRACRRSWRAAVLQRLLAGECTEAHAEPSRLVGQLKSLGIPIYAVGSQSHDKMDWPSVAQVDSTIRAIGATGVKVNITELDIDVLPPATQSRGADVSLRGQASPASNPYAAGLPDSVQQAPGSAIRQPVSRYS